jgi:hypothetical protein
MSNAPFRFPATDQERIAVIQNFPLYDETIDFVAADVALGLACQEFCHTRDDLEDFAFRHGLSPYLEPFLKRRGWIDDDWRKRLEVLNTIFQHHAN